jgi:TPR repeat protein
MTSAKHEKAPTAERLFLEAYRYEEARDFKSAFKCLLASAQLGDSGSQINLGNFYAEGKGVRRNLDEAARWYRKAYKGGERTGALNLAIDLKKAGKTRSAVIWFRKAVAMNDGSACIALAKLYMARKGEQKTVADLLRPVLSMSRADISDDEKEEAQSLLEEIAKQATRTGVAR